MSSLIQDAILGTILTASVPALFYCTVSAYKLLDYESTTKKAAKFTAEAGRQLYKSRTTQSAALANVLLSLATAGWLLFDAHNAPSGKDMAWRHLRWALLPVAAGVATRIYVSNFWKGAMKATLPGMTGYNDAIRATENGIWWAGNVLYGWGTYAVIAVLFI